jgi:hypothetical protein
MANERSPVKIERCDDGSLELRYLDDPDQETYRCWRMPINEARDLAQWWTQEGIDFKKGHTPIRDKRVGSLIISISAPTFVNARRLDEFGRVRMVGYSLPREVVEYIVTWLTNAKED